MSFAEFYDRYIGFGQYLKDTIDSRPTTFGVFSVYHITLTLIVLTFDALFLYFTRKDSDEELERKMRIVAFTMLGLEILRMIWFSVYRPDTYFIRFDWCNQVCLWMPICILARFRKSYPFFMGAAFLGGMGVMIYPLWVFRDYGGFHFMSIQSMISHGLMVLTSVLLMRMYHIKGRQREIAISVISGFTIMALIAMMFSLIRNINYMAMLSPKGLPIVANIPAPFHLIIVLPAELLGFFLVIQGFYYLQKKFLCKEEDTDEFVQEPDLTA